MKIINPRIINKIVSDEKKMNNQSSLKLMEYQGFLKLYYTYKQKGFKMIEENYSGKLPFTKEFKEYFIVFYNLIISYNILLILKSFYKLNQNNIKLKENSKLNKFFKNILKFLFYNIFKE